MRLVRQRNGWLAIVIGAVFWCCCAGCGSVGQVAGSPFSGIPAQSEPEFDHASADAEK